MEPIQHAASWLYGAISLTVVRMLPVAVSLIGTRLSAATVVFMGWFGPRGLASIVLGLVYLEAGIASAGRTNHQAGSNGDGVAEHFCPRVQRYAGDRPLRPKDRDAGRLSA